MSRYRIEGPRRKFWSDYDGWVDLHAASSYTQKERDTLPLPDAGGWVAIEEKLIRHNDTWFICYRGAVNLSQQAYKEMTGTDTEYAYREHRCWYDRDSTALVCLVGYEQQVEELPALSTT